MKHQAFTTLPARNSLIASTFLVLAACAASDPQCSTPTVLAGKAGQDIASDPVLDGDCFGVTPVAVLEESPPGEQDDLPVDDGSDAEDGADDVGPSADANGAVVSTPDGPSASGTGASSSIGAASVSAGATGASASGATAGSTEVDGNEF